MLLLPLLLVLLLLLLLVSARGGVMRNPREGSEAGGATGNEDVNRPTH